MPQTMQSAVDNGLKHFQAYQNKLEDSRALSETTSSFKYNKTYTTKPLTSHNPRQ